jgi:hypothetical protein
MLNLFQHLNFGPEADLEGWVIGLGLGLGLGFWERRNFNILKTKLLGRRVTSMIDIVLC